jgi:hypothetical protein
LHRGVWSSHHHHPRPGQPRESSYGFSGGKKIIKLFVLQIPNQLHFFTKIGDFLHSRCK